MGLIIPSSLRIPNILHGSEILPIYIYIYIYMNILLIYIYTYIHIFEHTINCLQYQFWLATVRTLRFCCFQSLNSIIIFLVFVILIPRFVHLYERKIHGLYRADYLSTTQPSNPQYHRSPLAETFLCWWSSEISGLTCQ